MKKIGLLTMLIISLFLTGCINKVPDCISGEAACTREIKVEESEVNLEGIDTEEKRKEGGKDEAMKLFNDMIPNGEFVNLVWEGLEEETREEGRLTIIQRNLRIVYNQDGKEWFWPGICETNFVEGKQNVIFSQSYMNI